MGPMEDLWHFGREITDALAHIIALCLYHPKNVVRYKLG
jgi:hypothetical protein